MRQAPTEVVGGAEAEAVDEAEAEAEAMDRAAQDNTQQTVNCKGKEGEMLNCTQVILYTCIYNIKGTHAQMLTTTETVMLEVGSLGMSVRSLSDPDD